MTTISTLLAKYLPRRFVTPAIALIYAGMLIAVLYTLGERNDAAIIYLDIRNN